MSEGYTCWLELTVIAKSEEVDFQKKITLPFVPFQGLIIEGDDDQFFIVDAVTWHNNGQYFILRSNFSAFDERCGCGPEDDCCFRVDVQWYRDYSWERLDARQGYERLYDVIGMHEPEKTFRHSVRLGMDVE